VAQVKISALPSAASLLSSTILPVVTAAGPTTEKTTLAALRTTLFAGGGGFASDVLPIASGGTGVSGTPTNGQLLIGNGTGFTLAALTAGSNVTITNSAGGITIAAAGGGGAIDGTLTAARIPYAVDTDTIGDSEIVRDATASPNIVFYPESNQNHDWGKSGNAWRDIWTAKLSWASVGTPLRFDSNLSAGTSVEHFEWARAGSWLMRLTGAGDLSLNGGGFSGSGASLTALNASNLASGTVPTARLGTGTANSTTFLRGDNTWQTISGGGDALTSQPLSQFAATTSAQLAGVISDETGSGSLVFATSPTLVTPNIGAATATTLTIGTNPATAGAIRLANNLSISGRNAANSGDITMLTLTSANNIGIGNTNAAAIQLANASGTVQLSGTLWWPATDNTHSLGASGTRWLNLFLSGAVAVGTNPASAGAVRLANNVAVNARNAANSGDLQLVLLTSGDVATFGAGGVGAVVQGSSITFTTDSANQVVIDDGVLRGAVNNDIDLGTGAIGFKDGYFVGTVTAGTFSGSGASLTSLNASNLSSGTVGTARLGTGTANSTTFLRGDGSWQSIPGGGDALTSSPLSQFAATTSAQLAGVISDETGSGALVFATSPTLTTPTFSGTATGSISGNAGTATALQTARTINGTSFDGTANITVTAAAGTLTGSTLASGVTASSLTSVGTLTALTMGGTVSMADNEVNRPYLSDVAEKIEAMSFSATPTFNYAASGGTHKTMTLTGNITSITLSNWPASGRLGTMTLFLLDDGTGGRTITWPAAVDWGTDGAPPAGTANRVRIVTLVTTDGGTNVYGAWKSGYQ
jgi:hypothetical protein